MRPFADNIKLCDDLVSQGFQKDAIIKMIDSYRPDGSAPATPKTRIFEILAPGPLTSMEVAAAKGEAHCRTLKQLTGLVKKGKAVQNTDGRYALPPFLSAPTQISP